MKAPKGMAVKAGETGAGASPFRIPNLPVEWLDGASWRLPSGKALAEFALKTGFLAPALMRATFLGSAPAGRPERRAGRAVPSRELR